VARDHSQVVQAFPKHFSSQQIQGLDPSCSFPNRRDTRVAKDLLLVIALDVPMATIDLNPKIRSFNSSFSEKSFQNRSHKPKLCL
jgi:hypothetical protein